MADDRLKPVVQELRRLALASGGELTDAELLERFVRSGEESAFAALVWRHGPMVLGVCRRLLGNVHDAEDAFQATFLVFVRKSAGLRKPELLANWLYGVACRTARQARTAATRRRARERVAARPEAREEPRNELGPVLDQALSLLPDRYRAAVVLCDLEGKSYREAARSLGCPEGTLAARVSRGRALLARRLTRQGVAFSSPVLAAALTAETLAAVPAYLTASTIQAAAGQATSAASTPAVALAAKVVRAMFLTKMKMAGAALVLTLAVGTGIGLLVYRAPAEGPLERPKQAPPVAKIAPGPPPVDRSRLRYGGKTFEDWRDILKTDLKPEVRAEAINALGTFGRNGYAKEAVAAIIKAARGYDIQHRYKDVGTVLDAASNALKRLGTEELPALEKEVQGKSLYGRRFAITVLKDMSIGKEAKGTTLVFVAAAKDKDTYVRETAVEALAVTSKKVTDLPALLAGLDIPGPYRTTARIWAIDNLRSLGPKAKPAIPKLLELAKEPFYYGPALRALRSIGAEPKQVLPLILESLKSEPIIADLAASFAPPGVGRSPPSSGYQILVQASSYLRSLKLPAKEAVPALVVALKNVSDPDEFRKIVDALSAFGPAAREALSALRAARERTTNAGLRKAIDRAIEKISK
jgi:RNA polymerase sigma factor (sigma-70 family)